MQNNVMDYLDNIVLKCPDKISFSDGEVGLTFSELYKQVRTIATNISNRNMYKEPVIVFMGKRPKTIAAFFGVITAGCYYVPIDDEMPVSRINLIMETCNPKLIICDEDTITRASELVGEFEAIIYEDIIKGEIDNEALIVIRKKAIDTDPIYIVFTSGSTGVPKGVVACHRSVIDYVEQLSQTLGFSENTIFANQTPLYFDACLKEVYPTIMYGATTYIVPKQLFATPVNLVEFLNKYRVNTICWVVSALTMISAFGTFMTVIPKYLTTVAFGSEVFPIKQFRLWKSTLPEAKFTNLYGPTEGTGMCCYYHVDRELGDNEAVPIGQPFKNTDILLLDENNQLAQDGQEGEICIRGTSVTLGYYNNEGKTRECFVQNPLQKMYPEIIYRTGDLAKKNSYGELVFVSRKDYQIKHMGHRIELGEIESNVNAMEEIQICGCIFEEVKSKIVLYYIGDIDKKELVARLKEKLPRYMIPNYVEQLDAMLFTANGKIDRVGLKNKYMDRRKK